MIERTIVSVDGPPGSGKTTFVEHLLRATDRWVQAVRCHREPDLGEPRESSPARDPELKRYRAAGADGAIVYRFPEPDPDAFYCSRFMEDPSDVVLEGERPTEYFDLDVFVAPVPGPRKKLLRRFKRNLARERRATVARMRTLLRSPEGTAKLVEQLLGAPLARFAESRPGMLESYRSELEANMDRIGSLEPSRQRSERWEITEPYRGIEHAQLVVINIRGDAERRRGERAREDVVRLRKETPVFEDIFGWRGNRVPITAVVADLSHERDPGLRKALRRALRAFGG
jgi:hypothetical protein